MPSIEAALMDSATVSRILRIGVPGEVSRSGSVIESDWTSWDAISAGEGMSGGAPW